MIRIGLAQTEGIDTAAVVNQVVSACKSQTDGHAPPAGIQFAGVNFNHQHMLNRIWDAFPGMEVVGRTAAGGFHHRNC